jgi:hypothetical protein
MTRSFGKIETAINSLPLPGLHTPSVEIFQGSSVSATTLFCLGEISVTGARYAKGKSQIDSNCECTKGLAETQQHIQRPVSLTRFE